MDAPVGLQSAQDAILEKRVRARLFGARMISVYPPTVTICSAWNTVFIGAMAILGGCVESEGETSDGAAETSSSSSSSGDATGTTGTDSGADASSSDGADTTSGGDGMLADTWSDVFADIISGNNCDNGYCHGGGSGGLTMTDAASTYAALVGVSAAGMACGPTGAIRVVPGDPDASLIIQKLEGAPDCGASMPKELPMLQQSEIDRLRAWILDGATNN